MQITINGESVKIDNPLNINELLLSQGYGSKLVAVALNGNFIAKSAYNETIINDNDDVEIVAPMQGG